MSISLKLNLNMLRKDLDELKSILDDPKSFLSNYFKSLKTEIEYSFTKNIESNRLNEKKKDELSKSWVQIINRLKELEAECFNNIFSIQLKKETKQQIDLFESVLDKNQDLVLLNGLIEAEIIKLKKFLFSNRTILFLDKNKCENKFLFDAKNPGKLIIIKEEFLRIEVVESLKNKNNKANEKLNNEKITTRILEIMIHLNKKNVGEYKLDLTEVAKFYLNGTDLNGIDDLAFQKLIKLEELNLSANKLNTINQKTFAGLNHLEFLHLSENLISSIETNTFKSLTNLKELNINSCLLASVKANLFQDLVNLQVLNLSNNKISFIENNSFQKLSNLKELFLSRNLLVQIQKKTFSGLVNLKMLDLSDNKIASIEPKAFQGLNKFKILILFRNPMSEFNCLLARSVFISFFYKNNSTCKVLIEDVLK